MCISNISKPSPFIPLRAEGGSAERRGMCGFTLIEMIVIIVVISIVAVGLLGVFTTSVARSADPMLRMQAVAIAQGYLDEALLKEYDDPTQAETGNCEAGEGRSTYDDVQDYDCVNDTTGANDQFGNPLAGLNTYNVDIDVGPELINGATLQRIDVIVTHDTSGAADITLTGYRADY